jgi:hypothetical protein
MEFKWNCEEDLANLEAKYHNKSVLFNEFEDTCHHAEYYIELKVNSGITSGIWHSEQSNILFFPFFVFAYHASYNVISIDNISVVKHYIYEEL